MVDVSQAERINPSFINNIIIVLQKVKCSLTSKGISSVRSLGRVFKDMGAITSDRKIQKDQFYVGLREHGVSISKKEAELLFNYLDTNKDGQVSYQEFLVGIRGQPNTRRQAIIDKAYFKFDRDGDGFINPSDLKCVFNCSRHPKVSSGAMNEDEVFIEFQRNFGDSQISREEWNDYYAAVSVEIESDQHFISFMRECWQI